MSLVCSLEWRNPEKKERYCILPDLEVSWKCSKTFEPEDPTQHLFHPPTSCDSSNTANNSVCDHGSAVGQLPIISSFILHEHQAAKVDAGQRARRNNKFMVKALTWVTGNLE